MTDNTPQQLSLFPASLGSSVAAKRTLPPYDREHPPEIGEIEAWAVDNHFAWIIGIDEAGRGPLAGPVYAAAVLLLIEEIHAEWLQKINDSKQLSAKDREQFEQIILANATAFATASSSVEVIDTINILQATKLAMKNALSLLLDVVGSSGKTLDLSAGCVLIDGNQTLDIPYTQFAVVKGDRRSRAIASASILAKVGRDREVMYAHQQWPQYGFDSHKGYASKRHREAIATHGPSPYHRRTFSGVKEFI